MRAFIERLFWPTEPEHLTRQRNWEASGARSYNTGTRVDDIPLDIRFSSPVDDIGPFQIYNEPAVVPGWDGEQDRLAREQERNARAVEQAALERSQLRRPPIPAPRTRFARDNYDYPRAMPQPGRSATLSAAVAPSVRYDASSSSAASRRTSLDPMREIRD